MPRYPKAGITKLSELEIDADKDWAAKKIENLGAPDTGDDAPRDDTIDSKITTHKGDASAHHAKTTDAGEIISGTFDLARIPTMDDAHIPDLNTLSGYPPSDPAAATPGLRTLGTGAQQAATGNHTHTLVHDTEGSDVSTDDFSGTNRHYRERQYLAAGDEFTFMQVSLTAATATVIYAVWAGYAMGGVADAIKGRLCIDGVQIAETSYFATEGYSKLLIGHKSVSSGNRIVAMKVKNYSGGSEYAFVGGGLGAGCAKV